MVQDSCCSVPDRSWRRRRRRNLVLTRIVVVITSLGITSCLHSSSLLPSCTHALSVPTTRLATSPLSTQAVTPTTTVMLMLDRRSLATTRHISCNRIPTANNNNNKYNYKYKYSNEFALFMAPQPPQPRQPRRMLKKRPPKEGDKRQRKRNRRNQHAEYSSPSRADDAAPLGTILPGMIITNGKNIDVSRINSSNSNIHTLYNHNRLAEYRPLVPSVRRDMGEDYWIDPQDLEREQRREEQERQRLALGNRSEEAMPQEKLMTEVKAPYRQNWIGNFSLMVALLSITVSRFPELLDPTPIIRFPDL